MGGGGREERKQRIKNIAAERGPCLPWAPRNPILSTTGHICPSSLVFPRQRQYPKLQCKRQLRCLPSSDKPVLCEPFTSALTSAIFALLQVGGSGSLTFPISTPNKLRCQKLRRRHRSRVGYQTHGTVQGFGANGSRPSACFFWRHLRTCIPPISK